MISKQKFNSLIWEFYKKNKRDLSWRNPDANGAFDPYKILVSEIMLQQTQVTRVNEKYNNWIKKFPTNKNLASASLASVIKEWNGLGYNRRAKYLHDAAKEIYKLGYFPSEKADLIKLPGVGKNTAGAILVYAFNKPEVFIETNIRTVFIHHFFNESGEIGDKDIGKLVEKMMDEKKPRDWYWALMDYGTFLKKEFGNNTKKSKHYRLQSKFKGSTRQIRGQILKTLSKNGKQNYTKLSSQIVDKRLGQVVDELVQEGLIENNHTYYQLPI